MDKEINELLLMADHTPYIKQVDKEAKARIEALIRQEVVDFASRLEEQVEVHYLIDEGGYEQEKEYTMLVPLSAIIAEKARYQGAVDGGN